MRRPELSPRLRMVGELVPAGARLADVGTDHAYLPAALLLEEKIPWAIAADLRQGPLDRARATVGSYGLTGRVEFCLCDGLAGVRPEEVDAIAIAGMGGETIAAILNAAPWTRERDLPLVLQPMSSMPELRKWLQDNGFRIETERLAREGDALYTALLVRAGEMGSLTPAELWAGRNSGDALRGAWLDQWLARTGRALEGMAQARGEGVPARRRVLEEVRDGLAEMRKEWEQWRS